MVWRFTNTNPCAEKAASWGGRTDSVEGALASNTACAGVTLTAWNSGHAALVTRIDLPDAAVNIHIDDQRSLTGMKVHPSVDADDPMIVTCPSNLPRIKDASNVGHVDFKLFDAIAHDRIAPACTVSRRPEKECEGEA